jgi:hypothetical protein
MDGGDGSPISELFPPSELSIMIAIRISKLLTANPNRILPPPRAGRKMGKVASRRVGFWRGLEGDSAFSIKSTAARRVLLFVASASGHETKTMEALEEALLVGNDSASVWN